MLKKKLNSKGSAVLEMIPVLIVVVVLFRYSYGFFGVVQTATLQAIAARNYAFETFRHRYRLDYLREHVPGADVTFFGKGTRVHGIKDEKERDLRKWYVARRPIAYPSIESEVPGTNSFTSRMASQRNLNPDRRFSEGEGTDMVWMSIKYGMCIDGSTCQ